MRESDIVSTMVIHYSSEGEAAVVAGADRVAAAQDKVAASANALATASETSSRRQASAAAAFQQMSNRMDPANRAMSELQRNIDVYGRALANNSSITDRAGQGLDVYREKINAQRTAVEALIRQQEILASQQRAAASAPVRKQDAIDKSLGINQVAAPSSARASSSAFFSASEIQAATRAQDEQTQSIGRLRAAMNMMEVEQGKLGAQSAIYNNALKSGAISADEYAFAQKRLSTSLADAQKSFSSQDESLSKLRASMRPLETEQGRLGTQMAMYRTMVKEGTMSAHEYATAQEMAGKRLGDFANNLRNAGSTGRVMSGEMANLGFQLNDIATGLALGQSPFMILAQQGGQVIQIFQQSRASIGDFASAAFAWVRSLISVPVAVAGITAAFVALDYAVSKSGEELEKLKKRFEGLAGIKLGNEYAKGLESLSRSLGTTMGDIQPAYEALVRLGQLNMPRSGVQIIGPGRPDYFDQSLISAEKFSDAVKTVFQQLRLGGASAADAAAGTNAFFESVSKSGKVTGKDLEALSKIAPQAAQSITNVLTNGTLSAEKLIDALDKSPLSFGRLLDVLRKSGPSTEAALNKLGTATDAAFQKMINEPKNVEDAWTKLEMKVKDVWRAISGDSSNAPSGQGHVPILAQGISTLADLIASRVPAIKQGMAAISDAFDPAKQAVRGWGDVLSDVSMKNGLFVNAASVIIPTMVKIGTSAVDAMAPFVPAFVNAFNSVTTAMGGFGATFEAFMKGLAASALSYAQQVASSIAKMLSTPTTGGGSGPITNNPAGDLGGGENFAGMSGSGGIDYASAVAGGTYPAFATGGSFVVGGSGGTDSQLIQFMATPGEKVTIDTPEATTAKNTLGSLIPSNDNSVQQKDVLSSHISQYLQLQTASLKDKLDQVTSGVVNAVATAEKTLNETLKTLTIAPASAAPTAASISGGSSAAAASSGLGSASGGGGGGGGGASPKKEAPTEASYGPALRPDILNNLLNQFGNGLVGGQGNSVKGASYGKPQQGDSWSDGLVHSPGGAVDEKGMPTKGALNQKGILTNNLADTGEALSDRSDGSVKTQAPRSRHEQEMMFANQRSITDYETQKQQEFSRSIAEQVGRSNPTPSDNWKPATLGKYDDDMNFIPNKTQPGRPASLGAPQPMSFPQYNEDLRRSIPKVPTPLERPEGAKASDNTVKQQTEQLKQSESQSSQAVEKAVHDSANAFDRVGSQTNESLAGVKNAAETTSESMGGVREASELTNGAITEGNTQQQEGLTQANQSLGEQTSATQQGFGEANSSLQEVSSGVGQASEAIKSGDQMVADATRSIESGIVSAVQSAASSISEAISSAASSIGNAVSSAVQSAGSSSSGDYSNTSDSAGYGGSSSGGNTAATDTGGTGFATGGQFTVTGPAGTDTEKVQFWASPGEVVTITPPGGRAPPNPARGISAKGGSPAFANGGQLTLGGMFGTPTIEKGSADLISASVSETMANQLAAIGNKIDLVSNRLVDTTSTTMKSIDSAISRLSSKIPDPVPAEAAPDAVTARSSGTSYAPSGDGWSGGGGWSRYDEGWAGPLGGYGVPLVDWRNDPRVGFNTQSSPGFANGGQFKVGRGGLPAFESGGQMHVNPVDDSGMTMATSVQPNTIASSIANKTQHTTANVGQKLETMASKITSTINAGTNRVISGVDAVGVRFDAWKDSVNVKAKTASATGAAGVAGATSGGGSMPASVGPAPPFMGDRASAAANISLGGMAEGGTFIVPGSPTAGSDSVNVAIKASPGERIMVLPPDQAKALDEIKNVRRFNPEPLDTFMPALSQDNIPSGGGSNTNYSVVGGSPPQGSPGRAARMGDVKEVKIYVQEGVSADTFIKSRAEIQRAVG